MVRGHAFVAKKRIVLLGRTLWEGEEYRVGQACVIHKILYIWSKTTLISSGVGGARVDPPPAKINTYFLRSLAHSVPI